MPVFSLVLALYIEDEEAIVVDMGNVDDRDIGTWNPTESCGFQL